MIVLDATALVDVALDQPSKEWVLGRLAGEEVCAPAHLSRSGEITAEAAHEALQEAAGLEQELVLPTSRLLARTRDLQERIRVLDGLYVALAEERGCPLVTTDFRLAGADAPCEIHSDRHA